ncbi:hypothetical protein N0V93_000722 [Gnomoniopsis smithogilvyi]|uniref:Acyl-CoA dehydrogenase n=1 Tax=Gnomoniopsis smithogilvyi TaxID=1191159 RepID=A0A9W8Z2I1_9PEZI|nr:hypothetical protein N0V93_000722 [Gnomoniopsis smithogilvyi]
MQAASSETGFFQQQPILKNQLHDDPSLRRILQLFLPSDIRSIVEPELTVLGDKVLSQDIFDAITDSEKSTPYLRGNGRDSFGRPRCDALIVTQGWTKLQNFGIENGVSAYNYDSDRGQYNRTVQMLRLILWEASSSNTTCPVAMQDGATRLLQRQLAKPDLDQIHRTIFQKAYDHLISRVPGYAWTSGQWMTERPGGSDVSQTETVATYAPYPQDTNPPLADASEGIPLGPWSISGFKWFSSATDSSMAVLLARTSPDKGVSAFFAPMRKHNPSVMSPTGVRPGTELNGVRIVRLKDKMGTKSLPTAELELKDMRGWLIGEEGKGIQEIATILNITRVHSSIGALGYLGRGLAVAKAYTLVREIGATRGRRISLSKSPLHMRTLSNMTTDYHAMMLFTFYTTFLLGLDEKASAGGNPSTNKALAALNPPRQHVVPLLRILSSLNKAYVCKHSIPLMYGCMESLGGVGYLNNAESEHLNLSRIFRDLCVLATWEGTTDVLSTDTLRALKHPREGKAGLEALDWFFGANKSTTRAQQAWAGLRARLVSETQDQLIAEARDICFALAEVLMASLLEVDVGFDGDDTARAMQERFLSKRGLTNADAETTAKTSTLEVDTAVVFGDRGSAGSKLASKL